MALRETAILAILLLAPLAAAQEEPTVNESDYDTSEPASDQAYLDESAREAGIEETPSDEPTVSEADFDTTAPTADTSYLDEAEHEAEGDDAHGPAVGTPGFGLVAALVAVAAALALLRRK